MTPDDCVDASDTSDVVLHLASSLGSCDDVPEPDTRVGNWRQRLGFRRSHAGRVQVHQVWQDVETGRLGFHVSDDDEFAGVPNMGIYESLTQLLDRVGLMYWQRWST